MVSMEAQLAEIAELRAQLARLPDLEDRKLRRTSELGAEKLEEHFYRKNTCYQLYSHYDTYIYIYIYIYILYDMYT
jgi:hypothetical protein